jgi:alkylation response protein AidB-like acyl-CoA dehydrogenase
LRIHRAGAGDAHTHQVANAAWSWQHQKAPVEGLLERVAAEQIVLLSSGGSDWLWGSGTATRVEGGYRIDARKVFASGAPAADVFMTGAVYDDPQAGPTVLHFAVPMKAPGVRILPSWRWKRQAAAAYTETSGSSGVFATHKGRGSMRCNRARSARSPEGSRSGSISTPPRDRYA